MNEVTGMRLHTFAGKIAVTFTLRDNDTKRKVMDTIYIDPAKARNMGNSLARLARNEAELNEMKKTGD